MKTTTVGSNQALPERGCVIGQAMEHSPPPHTHTPKQLYWKEKKSRIESMVPISSALGCDLCIYLWSYHPSEELLVSAYLLGPPHVLSDSLPSSKQTLLYSCHKRNFLGRLFLIDVKVKNKFALFSSYLIEINNIMECKTSIEIIKTSTPLHQFILHLAIEHLLYNTYI